MNLGLLGALGGLGQGMAAFGQDMLKQLDARDAEAKQLALEEWRARIREEYELAREKRAEDRRRAEEQRHLDTYMVSGDRARDSLLQREFEKFKADLGATDATEDELRAVFEQQYFDRSVAPGDANSNRYNPKDSDFLREQRAQAVGGMGAPTGLISELYKLEKDTLTRERQAEEDAYKRWLDQQKMERDERRDRLNEERTNAQIRALNASAERASRPSSSGTKQDDEPKLAPRQRSELKVLEDELKAAREAETKAISKSQKAAAAERRQELERRYQAFWDAVEGKTATNTPTDAPASATAKTPKPPAVLQSLPRGAVQVGTSGGKPVYRLPDGRLVIQQ